MKYTVTDKQTGKALNEDEIMAEVNRDRSTEWEDYTVQDLYGDPEEVLQWIDTTYYDIVFTDC